MTTLLILVMLATFCRSSNSDYALVFGGSSDKYSLSSLELITGESICIPKMEECPYEGDSDMELSSSLRKQGDF